jgi:hypothetical protein
MDQQRATGNGTGAGLGESLEAGRGGEYGLRVDGTPLRSEPLVGVDAEDRSRPIGQRARDGDGRDCIPWRVESYPGASLSNAKSGVSAQAVVVLLVHKPNIWPYK